VSDRDRGFAIAPGTAKMRSRRISGSRWDPVRAGPLRITRAKWPATLVRRSARASSHSRDPPPSNATAHRPLKRCWKVNWQKNTLIAARQVSPSSLRVPLVKSGQIRAPETDGRLACNDMRTRRAPASRRSRFRRHRPDLSRRFAHVVASGDDVFTILIQIAKAAEAVQLFVTPRCWNPL
jgi:hypothetical protein